ncbi:MAG: glycosyltransferase [Clostridiales bacterium]|nr:glycosyltransferase [Clostridiales bacterium]
MKLKYGFETENKVILFIGRLIEEKQPLKMIEIFSQLYQMDSSYRLLMVGTGPLMDKVKEKVKNANLVDVVTQIEKIPNSDIWELYRLADCFVNLNQQEIFGMAILEAMYYGCKVIAWHAPGPDFIIDDGVSGYLIGNDKEACERILDSADIEKAAKMHILNQFTWKKSAERIYAAASAER